jgi:hypothetical protein
MIERLDKNALWSLLKNMGPDETVVCVYALPEELAGVATKPEERDMMAAALDQVIRSIPTVVAYARIGMWCYMGTATAPAAQIGQWARSGQYPADRGRLFRIGVATAGLDGMATASTLELGAHEAVRSAPDVHIFVLSSDTHRVVPWR